MPGPLDAVELRVGNVVYRDCLSYSADSDLYQAGDVFRFELRSELPLPARGARCEMMVNGVRELTGIIDRRSRTTKKGSATLTLEGRDLLGLLVDSHVEEYVDLTAISLQSLATRLLKPIPFISRKDIVFERATMTPATSQNLDRAPRAEPGDSVFEVLSRAAKARGLLFYSEPGGRLVFGAPRARGTVEYELIHRRAGGAQNNVTESAFSDDLSKQYSKVIVLGQTDAEDADESNVLATVTDPTFPFYKTCVVELPHDVADANAFGRLALNKQRAAGLQVTYTVPGLSQGGRNWTPNRLVRVEDEYNDRAGVHLIYGRIFRLDKHGGARTLVRVGTPGVLQ